MVGVFVVFVCCELLWVFGYECGVDVEKYSWYCCEVKYLVLGIFVIL